MQSKVSLNVGTGLMLLRTICKLRLWSWTEDKVQDMKGSWINDAGWGWMNFNKKIW